MPKLLTAYREARKNKRGTADEIWFEKDYLSKLSDLAWDIASDRYEPSRGIAFVISKPVVREIFAAPFRDRVVHHFLFDMVYEWWDRRFIYDNYSCRKGKGNLFGIKRMQHHIMSVSRNGSRPAYVLKLDIQGYFMSLPRERLMERVDWGLKRQYGGDLFGMEYGITRRLWEKVIFDDPTRGVRVKGRRSDWDEKLPRSKSLFSAKEGCGIVIGNLTSQLLSNIYLDKLDRYLVYELGFRHYGRYVDDFYLVSDSREKLMDVVPKIAEFLKGMGLTLHPNKRYLQEVEKGVAFLGVVVYPWRIQPGARMKDGLWRAYEYGKGEESITSYMGMSKHFRHRKLMAKVLQD